MTDSTAPAHTRNQSLSEAVLGAQTALPDGEAASAPPAPIDVEEASVDLAEHHEALIGREYHDPEFINKRSTLATLGETPFTDDGDEVEHHRIVATEIVDPGAAFESDSPPILQNAIVLMAP